MATPIRIKRSAVPGKVPSQGALQYGELAINLNDAELYAVRNRSGIGSDVVRIGAGASITNLLYVTKDGNDANTGKKPGDAKLTIAGAVAAAEPGTVIKISAGTYVEPNPIKLPEQVSLVGDSLREVSVSPAGDGDLIYVSNGNYIAEMSFTGSQTNPGAIISFDPTQQIYTNQSPYVQNCTNFIPNSIGMRVNGFNVIGPLKSMVVDSYTQYNQGGIGVSITNDGYAQLVSIFTICNDISIYCGSGGACDITNSNTSFGNYGFIAEGVSPVSYIGIVTGTAASNTDQLSIDLSTPTLDVSNAVYDNVSGLLTIESDNVDPEITTGMSVKLAGLGFTCESDGGASVLTYPSGNYGYVFEVNSTANNPGIVTSLSNTGAASTIRAQVSGQQFDISQSVGSGNGLLFKVGITTTGELNVVDLTAGGSGYTLGTTFTLSDDSLGGTGAPDVDFEVTGISTTYYVSCYTGISTIPHIYRSGGTFEINVVRPFDGQVVYADELYNTIESVTVSAGGTGYTSVPTITIDPPSTIGDWGIQATAVAEISEGSVTSVSIVSAGRGYTTTPNVTITSPDVGINTATLQANLLPTYYSVSSSTPISSGICTVTFNENIPYTVGVGNTVLFFKQSRLLATGHSFEYVGSGTNSNTALPAFGGVPIQENEVVNKSGGLVVYTSTDQAGNFRIGEGVTINQLTGSITGTIYTKSLFSTMTPFILALGGD